MHRPRVGQCAALWHQDSTTTCVISIMQSPGALSASLKACEYARVLSMYSRHTKIPDSRGPAACKAGEVSQPLKARCPISTTYRRDFSMSLCGCSHSSADDQGLRHLRQSGTEAVGSPGARLPQQAFHCSAVRDPPKPAKVM